MKKFLTLFFSAMLSILLVVPAFASNDEICVENFEYSVIINEYDVYVAEREFYQDNAALDICTNKQKAANSDMIETELLRLAALSGEELEMLGYSDDQIRLLHDYNGERIEDYPEIRGAFGEMTASFGIVSASTSAIKVKLYWYWSTLPVLKGNGIHDLLVASWQGSTAGGEPLNVSYRPAGSYCQINYYYTNGAFSFSTYPSIKCESAYSDASAEVHMARAKDTTSTIAYAKSGIFVIEVGKSGTTDIGEVAFVMKYGHTKVVVTPSYTINPLNGSISFSFGTEEMAAFVTRVKSDGTVIYL